MIVKKTINKNMVKNFLIINLIGKNDSIGIKINNNFFIKKIDLNIRKNQLVVNKIFDFVMQKKVSIDKDFSVLVNIGTLTI